MFENNVISKLWAAKYFNTVTLETDLHQFGEVQQNIDRDTLSRCPVLSCVESCHGHNPAFCFQILWDFLSQKVSVITWKRMSNPPTFLNETLKKEAAVHSFVSFDFLQPLGFLNVLKTLGNNMIGTWYINIIMTKPVFADAWPNTTKPSLHNRRI